MRKSIFWGLVSLTFFTLSCQKNEIIDPNEIQGEEIRIGASFESYSVLGTKATENEGSFAWEKDDLIGIYDGAEFKSFKAASSGVTTTFVGSSVISKYAIYPHIEGANGHKYESGELTIHLPSEYDLDNSIPSPMVATIPDGGASSIMFKHVGGLLRFTVNNLPDDATKFVFSTKSGINGNFILTEDQLVAANVENNNNTVTINFTAKGQETDGVVFYIPLPTGAYAGYSVDIYNARDELKGYYGTNTNFEVKKADLWYKVLDLTAIGGSTPTMFVENDTDRDKFLKSVGQSSNPILNITSAKEVVEWILPESFTKDGTTSSNINITYTGVPTGKIVIKESGAAGISPRAKRGKVVVNIPVEAGQTVNVEVDTPSLTVEINKIGDGDLNIAGLDSRTAINTLVLGENVNVQNLSISGGNLEITGGTVSSMNVNVANLTISGTGTVSSVTAQVASTIMVIKEDDSSVQMPNDLPENTASATVTSEEANLRMAFKEGTNYTLSEDIDITESGMALTLPEGKSMTLDLNGKAITATGSENGQILVNGTLTITDNSTEKTGKIIEGKTYDADHKYNVLRATGENAKIIFNGGTVTYAEGVKNFGVGLREGADFEMNGGKIEALYYALAGNGNDKTTNSAISINGGELISTEDYSLYLAQAGTTTITDGTITGAAGGIDIQRGTLNISGNNTKIESTAATAGNVSGSGDGTQGHKKGALNIAGEYGDFDVIISGGTFVSNNTTVFVQDNSTNEHSISISGGTFSDPSALDYLTDNAVVVIDLNGKNLMQKNISISGENKTITLKSSDTAGTLNFSEEGNAAIELATKNSILNIENITINVGNALKALVCGSNETTTIGNTITINNSNIINNATDGNGIQLKNNHILNLTNSHIKHQYFGITQNGNHTGSTVTVTKGSISGKYTGIYLSNTIGGTKNTLTVDGTTITSTDESAIEVKKTDITVKNSTLKSDATTQSYTFSAGGSGGVGYGIVLAAYEEGRLYEGEKDIETNNTYTLAAGKDKPGIYEYAGKSITTAAELQAYLKVLTDAGSGHSAINIDQDITLDKDEDWTPVTIDGAGGAGLITINGNGHTIRGLNAPLFDGAFAGQAGIIINDLTIADSEMNGERAGNTMVDDAYGKGTPSMGVFAGGFNLASKIELNRCHAKNVKITDGSWVGLIGYSDAATNIARGCTVTDCEFTGFGAVGGIFGQVQNVTIENCTVSGSTFTNTENEGRPEKLGYLVGSIQTGTNVISGCTESSNNNPSYPVGRFVGSGENSTYTLDGKQQATGSYNNQ